MVEKLRFDPTLIVGWVFDALILLAIVYVLLYAVTLYFRFRSGKFDSADAIIRNVADDVSGAMARVWGFARPIFQLMVILFVIFWFAQTIGVSGETIASIGSKDIKTTLAFFVVGAFCIAAFLSESPATWLKDIALVVIGFYFGTHTGP